MLKMKAYNKNQGGSLIELMVALVVGVILITALVAMETNTITYSYSSMNANKLTYELQNTLNLIISDLRRAGYWGTAYTQIGSGANSNPFLSTTNISIGNSGSGTNNCILFGYDRNKNGSLATSGTASTNEHFGYRLSNSAVQALTSDTASSCSSTSSSWENITDANTIQVTTLSFALTSRVVTLSSGATLTIRFITVTITGQLSNDSSTVTTLSQMVRVRQDLYAP